MNKAYRIRSRAKTLDIICGAMDKDRSDPKHGPLYDAFKQHIASLREEFNNIGAESEVRCEI